MVVPLQATDLDVGDIVNFSVIQPAPAPFNVPGRVSTDGSSLRLAIPPGVRSMAPVTLVAQGQRHHHGRGAADRLSEHLGHDPAEPEDAVDRLNANVVTGQRLTMSAQDRLAGYRRRLHRREDLPHVASWGFGDGTATVPVYDDPSVAHVYARPGDYRGTVTGVVLWGTAQVATAPRTFNVTVTPDGRLIFKVTPTVARRGTSRTVFVKVKAQSAGAVTVTLVIGRKSTTLSLKLAAGQTGTVRFHTFSIRTVKTHRATIRVTQAGTLASGVAPTPVTRTIRF